MKSLCIVPVYNQASELPLLLERFKIKLACTDLIFIDDGSTDGSLGLLRQSRFPYLSIKTRQGIGHALIQGTKHAIRNGFDIVVHIAGNGKMMPSEMHRVLDPILENRADYVWGSRFLPGGRFINAPKFRQFGIPIFNKIPRIFTGKHITDATCGYRAYRLEILQNYALGWDRPWLYKYEFEYFVMAKVLMSRYRALEVPISMIYPEKGRKYSKITPVVSWWSMLKPWLVVSMQLDAFPTRQMLLKQTPANHSDIDRSVGIERPAALTPKDSNFEL